jgi:flagellar motor switch protein FliN
MDTELTKPETRQEMEEKSKTVFSSIPITVEVMLGTATLQLVDLMNLKAGYDLQLDQAIGEPVTVIVNGKKIAKGELYVLETLGDLLGVRITEIMSSDLS